MNKDRLFVHASTYMVSAMCVLLLLTGELFAQTDTGTILGTIKDQSGAVIAGAKVSVTNEATNAVETTATSQQGVYTVPLLPPGQYGLNVTKEGFEEYSRSGITLQVNQTAQVNAELALGSAKESVTVVAAAPLLDTETSSLGQVVNGTTIANLPLNGRQVFRLVTLTPGILTTPATGGQFHDISVNTTFDSDFSINGGRAGNNEFLIDGVPSTAGYFGQITTIPLVEDTQEFKVQSSDLPAQYGRFAGGVVNVITKSGGNQLHGSLFEFLRNDKFDANDFFTNQAGKPKPEFRMNQFGYAVGGPVVIPHLYNGRNRTFFFTDYQGTRWVQGNVFVGTVPTLAQRAGDFSQTFNSRGQLVNIYDPSTTRLDPSHPGQYIRNVFPNNAIPATRLNSVGSKLLTYYPLPNTQGAPFTNANNFISNAPRTISKDQFDVRIDQNFGERNRLFGRYSQNLTPLCQPNLYGNAASPNPGSVGCTAFHEHSATLGDTITLSPTFLLSLHYGFARWFQSRNTLSYGFDLSTLGLPSSYVDAVQIPMFPAISATGFSGEAGQSFLRNGNDSHAFLASATKVTGKQIVTFGTDIRLHRINIINVNNTGGAFNFTPGFTQGPNPNIVSSTGGSAIASLLLGDAASGSVPIGAGASLQDWYFAGYVEDDWRVTNNLTLNFGLRYETETPYTERHNALAAFDASLPSPAANSQFPGLQGGLVFAGVDGQSRTLYNWNTKNFSPRFGFAYSPASRTVVRGGFNLFYPPLDITNNAVGTVPNPGYSSSTSFVSSIDGGLTPFDSLSNPFPNGLVQPTNNMLGAATYLGQAITVWAPNVKSPYMMQWNFDIQQSVTPTILLDVGYSGSHGVHLTRDLQLDQLNPQYLSLGTDLQASVANPFAAFVGVGPLSQQKVAKQQLLLPYPQFTSVDEINDTSGSSIYHSLQVKVDKRLSHGTSFLLSYTTGKLITDTNTQQAPIGGNQTIANATQNYYDLRAERGLSELDVAQSLVFSFVGNLPFGPSEPFFAGVHGLPAKLIGGWRVNGIFTAHSGFPLGMSTSIPLGGDRPNSTGVSANLPTSRPDGEKVAEWFDIAAFTQPGAFTFGNVGRTLGDVRGPAFINTDFSLIKTTHLTERFGLEFRAEAFNIFNNPHFYLPDTNLQDAGFGTITSTVSPPRQIQFALQFIF